MINSGWIYTNIQQTNYAISMWQGWGSEQTIGSISVVLKGDGQISITYGNGYSADENGWVRVLHNDIEIDRISDVSISTINFQFLNGDILKFEEGHGAIVLHDIQFLCTSNLLCFLFSFPCTVNSPHRTCVFSCAAKQWRMS